MNKIVQPHRRDFKRIYTWTLKDVVEYYGTSTKKINHKNCGMCKAQKGINGK